MSARSQISSSRVSRSPFSWNNSMAASSSDVRERCRRRSKRFVVRASAACAIQSLYPILQLSAILHISELTAMPKLDANSTTDDVLRGVDLSGKRALVTGASGGLGRETARALAAAGATVVLAARSVEKTDAAVQSIREHLPRA